MPDRTSCQLQLRGDISPRQMAMLVEEIGNHCGVRSDCQTYWNMPDMAWGDIPESLKEMIHDFSVDACWIWDDFAGYPPGILLIDGDSGCEREFNTIDGEIVIGVSDDLAADQARVDCAREWQRFQRGDWKLKVG